VGAVVAGTFGSLTLNADGSYAYTLDNTLAAVQALAPGAQLLDPFTYQAFDGLVGTDSTLTVTIEGTNDAPVVDLDVDDSSGAAGGDFTAGTFTEGGPALSLADLDRDISDVDNATIASLTLTLAANPDGVDETIAANAAGTGLTVTPVSNTLIQVTGAGSLADFEAVLGTLTYENTSQNPTAGARSVTAIANDGTDDSVAATANFIVAGDNDAPAVDLDADDSNSAGLGFDAGNYARGNAPLTIVDTDASVTDIDSQIQTLTVTFSAAPPDGASELLAVTLGASGLVLANIANGIQLTGPADPAVFQGVLQTLTYENTSATPSIGARTINVTATDADAAPLTSPVAAATVTVVPTVFFIDNSVAGGPGDGSQTNPFRSIAEFNAVSGQAGLGNPQAGDTIFIRTGTGTYSEADGINLLDNQTLLGQERADLLPAGVTGEAVGTAPVIAVTAAGNNGIDLGSGNTIRGLDIGDTTGSGIEDGGGTVGTLTISDLAIGGTGKAIDIDQGGTLAVTLESITSNNSASEGIDLSGISGTFAVTGTTAVSGNSGNGVDLTGNTATFSFAGLSVTTAAGSTGGGLNATGGGTVTVTGPGSIIDTSAGTGTAVNIASTTIGTDGVTFRSVSADGATNGIVLDTTGDGAFTVTGDGTNARNNSGGTIQNTTSHAIVLNDTGGFSISSMLISDPGDTNVAGGGDIDGIHATEIRGINLIRGSTLQSINSAGGDSHGIELENNGVSLVEFRIVDSFFDDSLGGSSALRADLEAGTVNGNFAIVNNIFEDHSVAAVDFAIGDSTGGSGTIDIVIADNNFNGRSDVIVSNDIIIAVQDDYTVKALVHNNAITEVKPAASLAGVISVVVGKGGAGVADGQNPDGPNVDLRFTENTIDEIRGRRGFNFIIEGEVEDYDLTLFNNIVTDLVNGTGPAINAFGREAVEINIEDDAGNGEVRIVENTLGTTAEPVAGNGSREALNIIVEDGSGDESVNPEVLIHGNSLVTSAISTGEAIELDIEDTSSIELTVTNNNLTGGNQDEGFTIETEDAGSTANVKFTGNTSADEIEFDEDAGTLTITDRDALAADNPGVTGAFSLVDTPGTTAADPTLPSGVVLATGGLSQIVATNAAAGTDLQVTVLNADGSRAAGVTVTFTAPGAGASGTFTGGNTAVTNAQGVATKGFTANGTEGAYEITATAAGFEGTSFLFQNEAVPALFLTAAEVADPSLDGADGLSQAELDVTVEAAEARWADANLSAGQLETLQSLSFEIVDLGGAALSAISGTQVQVDIDAAGHGWFVDETPLDDSEFDDTDGPASGSMDLLTAVMHEMGHALGLEDLYTEAESGDLMFALLETGERRLPGEAQADGEQADGPVVALATDDFLQSPNQDGGLSQLGEAPPTSAGTQSAPPGRPAELAEIGSLSIAENGLESTIVA